MLKFSGLGFRENVLLAGYLEITVLRLRRHNAGFARQAVDPKPCWGHLNLFCQS